LRVEPHFLSFVGQWNSLACGLTSNDTISALRDSSSVRDLGAPDR
jgi:hypothetical protein